MMWLLGSIFLTSLAGVPGLLFRRDSTTGERLACALTMAGCICGLIAVALVLLSGSELRLDLPWSLPGGELALRLDAITAAFLLPLFLVVAVGAVYGLSYWPQRVNPDNGRKLRLFYGLLSGAMILLLSARNGVLFLMGWEVMALAGFFSLSPRSTKRTSVGPVSFT